GQPLTCVLATLVVRAPGLGVAPLPGARLEQANWKSPHAPLLEAARSRRCRVARIGVADRHVAAKIAPTPVFRLPEAPRDSLGISLAKQFLPRPHSPKRVRKIDSTVLNKIMPDLDPIRHTINAAVIDGDSELLQRAQGWRPDSGHTHDHAGSSRAWSGASRVSHFPQTQAHAGHSHSRHYSSGLPGR